MKAHHESSMPQNLETQVEGGSNLKNNEVNGELQKEENSGGVDTTHESNLEKEKLAEMQNTSSIEATSLVGPLQEIPKEPIDLEKLYKEDIVENPDAEFDIEGQIKSVENSLAAVDGDIDELRAVVDRKKEQIARIRSELGTAAPSEESIPEEHRLQELVEQKKALEAKKKEAEEMEELQELMNEIDKMPPEVRIYIINNGTTPEGKPLQTKSGKEVNKEVAMSLAKSIEEGVKKLTKAVVKVVLGIVKGVLKGIFAAIKGEGTEQK